MLEWLLVLKNLLTMPLFWGMFFMVSSVLQFFLARKLSHPQAWFAFLPGLKQMQWLQMGRVSVVNLLVLIPGLSLWFIPVFGPTNLQIIILTLKVVFLLQLGLFLFGCYLQAALQICVRAGERRSFVVWFAIPGFHLLALAWLAFKKQFWVKEAHEVEVIQRIIKNLDDDKTVEKLKTFALNKGYNKSEFEILADKALTIENNQLALGTQNFIFPKGLNFTVLGIYILLISLLLSTILQQSPALFDGNPPQKMVAQFEVERPQSEAKGVKRPDKKPVTVPKELKAPEEFVFLMQVNNFRAKNDNIVFDGALALGDSINRSAQQFYLLDENFKLLDSASVKSVSGLFGQFRVEVTNAAEPEAVAYIAETKSLRALNSLGQPDHFESLNQVPLMVITGQNRETNSHNQELKVNVKRSLLNKTDKLYVFDQSLKLVNAAEIIYLIDPSRNSIDAIKPTKGVELVLEFAREYSGEETYLTPLKDIDLLKDYLEVLNL